MSDNVVSLTGAAPAKDPERELVEYFGRKVREFVDRNGVEPTMMVCVLMGTDKDGDRCWSTGFISDPPRSKFECHGAAAALLLRQC